MLLHAQIIEPITGKVDPELSVEIRQETLVMLLGHPDLTVKQFPLLNRIKDVASHVVYKVEELESLIAETEQTTNLFEFESPVRKSIGPFHLVCVLAFLRRKNVVLTKGMEN